MNQYEKKLRRVVSALARAEAAASWAGAAPPEDRDSLRTLAKRRRKEAEKAIKEVAQLAQKYDDSHDYKDRSPLPSKSL